MATRAVEQPSRLERILACAPEDPVGLVQALEGAEWGRLMSDAREHGVFTLLVHECDRVHATIPQTVREEAARHHAIAAVWHSHLAASLDGLGALLSAARLHVVALKGPLLAERLYPGGALRPSVDLDLLVAEEELERAVTALEGAGWRADSGPAAAYSRRYHHHLQLQKNGQPPLELHFRARVGFGTVMPAADLIRRSQPTPTAVGHGLRALAPEDEFVYLAIHAAAHGFVRLMWLYDLKLFWRRYMSELDWKLTIERARQVRVLNAVAFTCEMLRERLHVPIADLPELRSRGLRPRLARRVQRRVARHEGLLALDRLGGLAFTSLLCDRPLAGARLWAHHGAHIVKRRVQRRLPKLVPADWAG